MALNLFSSNKVNLRIKSLKKYKLRFIVSMTYELYDWSQPHVMLLSEKQSHNYEGVHGMSLPGALQTTPNPAVFCPHMKGLT